MARIVLLALFLILPLRATSKEGFVLLRKNIVLKTCLKNLEIPKGVLCSGFGIEKTILKKGRKLKWMTDGIDDQACSIQLKKDWHLLDNCPWRYLDENKEKDLYTLLEK